MKAIFTVMTFYTQWESKAGGYVTTRREITLETTPGETVAAFADRACDILMPRPDVLQDATPAQFRFNTCRHLYYLDRSLPRINEAALVDDELALGNVLELRPRPLIDG